VAPASHHWSRQEFCRRSWAVPGVGLWRRAVMHPGDNPDGPFAALAEALVRGEAIPELLTSKQDIGALARHLKASVENPAYSVVAALNQVEDAARARGDLLRIESSRLAIVIDQLEELFTAGEITADDRNAFIRCLDGLAKSGRVSVIVTMRSDYWHRAAEVPLLVDIAGGSNRIDLLPPTQDEILEMIRQPAEAAGLEFEEDPAREIKLDATLAAESQAEPGALPLLSFLLDELYKKDVQQGRGSTLTFASMRGFGGLQGAIANRADAAFTALPADTQTALPKVLRALVTVSHPAAEPTARAVPMKSFSERGLQIVEAFLDPRVRLLVADGDTEGARIRIAHEALITHWDTARNQIARDRADLELRSRLEQEAALWRNSNDESRLLGEGTPLEEAKQLLSRYPDELGTEITRFIEASTARWEARQDAAAGRGGILVALAARFGLPVPVKRDLRPDLFLGIALWLMYLSWVQPNIVNWINISNYGFSDATEIFLFCLGYTMALAYGPVMRERGFVPAAMHILGLARRVYVAYILLFYFYLAEISYVSASYENPLFAEETGIFDFLRQPDVVIVQALLLKFRPVNMDVLPIYIVLLLFFPPVLWLLLRRANLALVGSLLLYIVTWETGLNLPVYPSGYWTLNPFAWQLLFIFGGWCALGGAERLAGALKSRITLVVAILYLLFAFGVTLTWYVPRLGTAVPHWLAELIYPIDKTNIDVLRIAHFVALAALTVRFISREWSALRWPLLRAAILCGQHSLEIFCFGVFLAFAGNFALVEVWSGTEAQIAVSLLGILAMIAAASWLTWDYAKQPSRG
jgi:hypothetical protein